MTWGEFKAAVESQGVEDYDVLAFIDVHTFGQISVDRDSTDSIEIHGFDDYDD